jgi:hypothetical protein
MSEGLGFVLRLALVAGIYFLPALLAQYRKHKNASAIGVLNVFLGWTVIGWIVALIWAHTDNAPKPAAAVTPGS